MNKYDRRKLNISVEKYCAKVIYANQEFSNAVDSLKHQEENKLEHLPASLGSSRQASNIEEAIKQISDLQVRLNTIETTICSIMERADIDVPRPAIRNTNTEAFDTGPRKNRFQILLPDQLLILMKMRAMQSGISCNELICQAIQNELLKDPHR